MKIKFKTNTLDKYDLIMDYDFEDYMLINRTDKILYDDEKNVIDSLYKTIQYYSYIYYCQATKEEIISLKSALHMEYGNEQGIENVNRFFQEIKDDYVIK